MDSREEARAELQQVADEVARLRAELDAAIATRFDVVERARAAGVTWRDAALILGMTETGLMKTQQATRGRSGR